ncbi:hypothetical protein DNH61_15800 [Paenibacillus sambharensis]|uniref:DUF2269 domain-containing protein n=1 Tax=Paenibacillus sambharensis TaxID=1803190 RepID=A0A2W1L6F7_9BACL|nr:DUF2269 family protein [Paenibacillus sambharensis]PZD94846.1 hypothetical protein DNH61_15800 [Paenibacillus sambharensis]
MNLWLTLHVLGAILFIGNIIITAFWKVSADWSGNPHIIVVAARSVLRADLFFTLPGISLLLLSGHMMIEEQGYSLWQWSWLSASYLMFLISGILWLTILLPAQRKMLQLAQHSRTSGAVCDDYRRTSRRWNIAGTIATVLPLLVLLLMVVKRLP